MSVYCIVVFAHGLRVGKRRKNHTQMIPYEYGYVGWTADQSAEPHRLPGSGSFCYHDMHAAYAAAQTYLAREGTHQVSIRTNQDRCIYRYFKHADGSVTGYGERE